MNLISDLGRSATSGFCNSVGQSVCLNLSKSVPPLPNDIIPHILRHLPPKEACKFACVSKTWQNACDKGIWRFYEPRDLFPGAVHLDIGVWKRRVPEAVLEKLTFNETHCPRIDKKTYVELQGLKVKRKTRDERFTVLRLLAGLDFNILIDEIMEDTTCGPKTPIGYISKYFINEHGGDKLKEDQTVVILNEVLEGSESLSLEKRKALASQSGCELEALKVASLCVLRHKEDSPVNFNTTCSNKFKNWAISVSFGPAGLSVYRNCDGGAGALRKFMDIGT